MSRNESIEQLWIDNDGEAEKRGSLFDERTALHKEFSKARTFIQTPVGLEYHDESLVSGMETFDITLAKTETAPKRQLRFSTKCRQTIADNIYIAIQQMPRNKQDNDIDPFLHEYILNSNGTVISTEELSSGADITVLTETDLTIISTAARTVSSRLRMANNIQASSIANEERMAQYEKNERRGRILRGIGATVITLTAVGGVGVGSYLAWQEWIHKPGVADDIRRENFDKQNYSIDGRSIELDDQQLTPISAEEFAEIPSFKDGDSLEFPRTATLDSETGCAEIEAGTLEGVSVKVGVAEYNPLGAYPVTVYASDKTTLNVCAVGDLAQENLTNDQLTVAIQLTQE